MNFPLVALLLLAAAAVNAVPSPSADDAFSIASDEITNLLQQGNDESACADLAKSLADEVASSIDSKQKALDAVGVGAHCKDEGQEAVSAAESNKEAKDKAAQDAAESCESAKNADVTLGAFSLSSMTEGECGQFFQDSAYTGAKAAAKSACDAQVTADAEASAAATTVTSAKQAAAHARNTCRCQSKTDYNNAVAAANANTEDEQKAWAKAKNMACVLQGVGASDCKVDAMPEVVAKDLPEDVASAVCKAEILTTLAENNFNNRGDKSLSTSKTYTYSLANGYTAELSGWTHTRNYAKGFLRNKAGKGKAVVTGLKAGAVYQYKVYQFASKYAGSNPLSVNGESQGSTQSGESDAATAEGEATATSDGQITFTFTRDAHHVHLSGLAVAKK